MNDIKTALVREMENYFGEDTRRIDHAREVTEYAEELLKKEVGGDYVIVVAAGLLHDIGIHAAESKYGSTHGKYQEIEGPPIARQILLRLNFTGGDIDRICDIIAHHHSPGKVTTQNFKIVYDADWLVNLRDEHKIRDKTKLEQIINKVFLTESGKALARGIYLTGMQP